MAWENKYFWLRIGWLQDRGKYGFEIHFCPRPEAFTCYGEMMVSHSMLVFLLRGWARKPYVFYWKDPRYNGLYH